MNRGSEVFQRGSSSGLGYFWAVSLKSGHDVRSYSTVKCGTHNLDITVRICYGPLFMLYETIIKENERW